jgi:hypothetical protein
MAKKKIFFDFEFTGLHKLTTPISMGLVCEDGRTFYAEFTDFDKFQIDDYVRQNVLQKRTLADFVMQNDYNPSVKDVKVKGDIDTVYEALNSWISYYKDDGVEMWGDLLQYDWVLFINIFGSGKHLPKFIDYIPMDICTALKLCGEEKDIDRLKFAYGEEKAVSLKEQQNNSLFDAQTSLEVYKKLMDKMVNAKNKSLVEGESEEQENSEELDDEISKDMDKRIEQYTTEAPKKKRGRPKKKKEDFVEPTQADVESSEEFNPPL